MVHTASTSAYVCPAGNVKYPVVTEEFLYFKEVTNTTETAGGSGEESDTAYYNRMRESGCKAVSVLS